LAEGLQLEPEGRYRQVVLRPSLIIYRVVDDVVWILRLWDSRRAPESLVVKGVVE